jgi:hypothetical protein
LQYLLKIGRGGDLPALKIFRMLGETNNQFYMALWLARKKIFGPVKISHWPKWHNGGPKVKSDITCFNPL